MSHCAFVGAPSIYVMRDFDGEGKTVRLSGWENRRVRRFFCGKILYPACVV